MSRSRIAGLMRGITGRTSRGDMNRAAIDSGSLAHSQAHISRASRASYGVSTTPGRRSIIGEVSDSIALTSTTEPRASPRTALGRQNSHAGRHDVSQADHKLRKLALSGDRAEACIPTSCRSTVFACHRNRRASLVLVSSPPECPGNTTRTGCTPWRRGSWTRPSNTPETYKACNHVSVRQPSHPGCPVEIPASWRDRSWARHRPLSRYDKGRDADGLDLLST
jgi:hypothetical protein